MAKNKAIIARVPACELQGGTLIDLQGDRFGGHRVAHALYDEVDDVVRETEECVCVYTFQHAFGCPPNHLIRVFKFPPEEPQDVPVQVMHHG